MAEDGEISPELSQDEDTNDPSRITRRTAMKTALAGGVAAGVFVAPRIMELSLSPNYADALSCLGATQTYNHAGNTCPNLIGFCWGNVKSKYTCSCSGQAYSINAGSFAINGNITGDGNSDNGAVNFAVTGLNTSGRKCTVDVSGSCSGSSGAGNVAWRSTNSSGNGSHFTQVFSGANGNGTTLTDCQGNLVSYANHANLTVTLACTCS